MNKVQMQLNYPETNMIKVNELKSCSQPSYWRKFLAFLCWLVELTDYVMNVDLCNTDDQNQPTELFIKNLCQSQEPDKLIDSRQYFDFIS